MRSLKQITIDGNNMVRVCPYCECLVIVTGFTEEEIQQYKDKPVSTPTAFLFPWMSMSALVTLVSGICQDCQSTGARLKGERRPWATGERWPWEAMEKDG